MEQAVSSPAVRVRAGEQCTEIMRDPASTPQPDSATVAQNHLFVAVECLKKRNRISRAVDIWDRLRTITSTRRLANTNCR